MNSHRVAIKAVLAVTLGLAAHRAAADSLATYHVGNSLTVDAGVTAGLPVLASDAGHTLTAGYHIRCSRPLTYIIANPTDVCVEPNAFGTYVDAFSNHAWDAITLQPHAGGTLREEYEAAKFLIETARQNPANADTTFYLYATWDSPPDPQLSFYRNWYEPTLIDPDAPWARNAEGFKWIYRQLKSDPDLVGVDLSMLPVGDVLAEVDQRLRSGQAPGFAGAYDLYRDVVHLNNLGRFVAANTFLAMMFDSDPAGLPTNDGFNIGNESEALTPELAAVVQDAVWDVVNNPRFVSPLAGDADADGFVGVSDLTALLGQWGQAAPVFDMQADATGDGFIGVEDLTKVLGAWNQAIPPGDLNEDGFIGIQDLNLVISLWNQTEPLTDERADPSGDGLVGIEDLNLVISAWNRTIGGDLDGDGLVGIADLAPVLGGWNQALLAELPAVDMSGDGFLGIEDLNLVLGNWNTGDAPGSAAVPEPSIWAILCVAAPGFARRRHRC